MLSSSKAEFMIATKESILYLRVFVVFRVSEATFLARQGVMIKWCPVSQLVA